MNATEDAWCDWCGAPTQWIYRYQGRVFCTVDCILRYQTSWDTTDVIDLSGVWVERDRKSETS